MSIARLLLAINSLLVIAFPVAAQVVFDPPTNTGLLGIICTVRDGLFPFLLAFAVIAFLVSGGLYFTAGGDASKLSKAKKAFMAAIIGVVIAILSFGLPAIIFSLFGVNPADAC